MRKKHLLSIIITVITLTSATLVILFFASGYRVDLENQNIHGTGILSANSVPDGALIYVNDVPKDATNTSITSLRPGDYDVRLEKDGFANWIKNIQVEEEIVTKLDALLIPLSPSLNPLTHTGVHEPILSPDDQKLVYKVKNHTSSGIWMVDLEERPFNLSREPQVLLQDTATRTYSEAISIMWSPDSTEILIEFANPQTNPSPTPSQEENLNEFILYDIINGTTQRISDRSRLIQEWKELEQTMRTETLSNLPNNAVKEINNLQDPVWSPDDKYILYTKEGNDEIKYYIYIVPQLTNKTEDNVNTPTTIPHPISESILTFPIDANHKIKWYPDSKHLLILTETENGTENIEIIEVDGENRTHIFSGNIKNLKAFPSPNGSRIVTLTKFNPESERYNLYGINLR